jgi:hypothetical protein
VPNHQACRAIDGRCTLSGHGRQALLNCGHSFGARALGSSGIKRRFGSVFERQLHGLGIVDPGDFGHYRQGHIDTSCNTATGNDVAVAYNSCWIWRHAKCREQIPPSPMTGSAPPAQ